jgi:hypothetical protein|tara:strand:+ start:443 stop:1018 length:576 start_codon:yes stop_codon:yes gene_type:complete
MAFLLDGKPLAVDVPFTVGDVNYPANWLRLSTAEEKAALKITEIAEPTRYDSRFYLDNGTAKALNDVNATYEQDASDGSYKKGDLIKDENGDQVVYLGVKSILKAQEKVTAGSLLSKYDWYVVRKAEKSTAIPAPITTYRDAVRTACDTREKEIDACSDTAALVTLYGATYDKDGNFEKFNMTQYPDDPNE